MRKRTSHVRKLLRDPLIRRIGIGAALALLLVVFRASVGVRSAPLTAGKVERVAVSNGVITVAPGGATDSVMELGNHGNEIVSTGPIFLRPGGTEAGTRFTGNSDQSQDLSITGDVAIGGGFVLGDPSNPANRKTVWPEPDGWSRLSDGTSNYLAPIDRTFNISTGTQPLNPEAYGFGIYSNAYSSFALNVSNYDSSADAIVFNSKNVEIRGDLRIFPGSLYSRVAGVDSRVWTTEYDGKGSGLVADILDGKDTYVAGCGTSVCLCTVVADPSQNHCQVLVPKEY